MFKQTKPVAWSVNKKNVKVELLTDFCFPTSFFLLSPEDQTLYLSTDPPLPSACSLSPSTASPMKMKICSPCSLLTRWSPSCSHGDLSHPQFWGSVFSVQAVQEVNWIRIVCFFYKIQSFHVSTHRPFSQSICQQTSLMLITSWRGWTETGLHPWLLSTLML